MNRPIFSVLFLFLLPALLVAFVVTVLNVVSLKNISESQIVYADTLNTQLNTLNRVISLVVQTGLLHDEVSQQLQQSKSGKLDEAGAYRIHAHLVDYLARIEADAVSLKPLLLEANLAQPQLASWYKQFVLYRNLVLMATDIAAIEPATAGQYITQAQTAFFALSAQTFSLSAQLSDQVKKQSYQRQLDLQKEFQRTYWNIALSVLIAVFIAILVSRYLSRQLQMLLVQMQFLSNQQKAPEQLPEVEALTHSLSLEIKRLANAVLGFHYAMKERDSEQERVHQLAFYDGLTGLPNRTKMLQLTEETITARLQDGCGSALIKLNINQIKVINDGLGYDQGNQLLVQVADRLVSQLDAGYSLARTSGDEFVILVDNLGNIDNAQTKLVAVMHRIHALFNQSFELKQQSVFVTVALGSAVFTSQEHDTVDELFMHAIIALHAAKALSTEQSMIYHSHLEDMAKQRIELDVRLRIAIQENHLQLYFQPQVGSSGTVVSVEALVRWLDPQHGLLSPSAFIPMAEQSDLIIDLDRWVLRHACNALKKLQEAGLMQHVSVNISGKHFAKDFFVQSVMNIVTASGIDKRGLMLEVTEGVFIDDLSDVIAKMEQLSLHGITFSIDDFGTGYSSLQYLKHLPIHELKIDKSFVDGLPNDAGDVALVKTIVGIANNLNLSIVVEGVETQQQAAFLNTLGSFVMQGYYYARPQPAQEIITQILTESSL